MDYMRNNSPGHPLLDGLGGSTFAQGGFPDVECRQAASGPQRAARRHVASVPAAAAGLVFDAYLHARALREKSEAEKSGPTITVSNGGDAVRMRDPVNAPSRRGKGAVRGKVAGFSRASRLRMLEVCGSIDRRQVGVVFFVTYTTRKGSVSWADLERRRRALFMAMVRQYQGRFFAIWRKERGAGGMLHLHVLIFWLGTEPHLVREFRPWNDETWNRICGEPIMCQSEFMRSWNGVKNYLAVYCAKDAEFEDGDSGRQWGLVNRALIPVSRESIPVAREVYARVCRWLVKLERKKREKWLFGDHCNGVKQPLKRYRGVGIHPRLAGPSVRVKRVRPRVFRNVRETIWQEVREFGEKWVPSKKRFLPVEKVSYVSAGVERKAVPPSLRFADAETVKRLISLAERQYISDREDAELPF